MRSLIQLQTILLVALATLSDAVPFALNIQKRSFKVERVPNPSFQGRTPGAGTRALIKAHMKFQFDLPQGLLESMMAGGAANNGNSDSNTDSGSDVKIASVGAGGGAGSLLGGLDILEGASSTLSSVLNPGAANDVQPAEAPAKAPAKSPAKDSPTANNNNNINLNNGNSNNNNTGESTYQQNNDNDAPRNGGGIVTATPINGDVEYLSPVSIGGQTIDMDFDTGSSNLWVFSALLPPTQIGNHRVYDSSKSSTFAPLNGQTFKIAYGDGSGASGIVGTDTVNIGGATVTKQEVEMATFVSQSFTADTGSNGLVGLAYSKLNSVKPTPQKTFFDNIAPTLPEPVFTADLRSNAVGSYEFGRVDSTKYNGTMSWTPIDTSSGFWQFPTSRYQVGQNAPVDTPGGKAIADTGTTLMLTSPAIANAYYRQVKGAANDPQVGGFTFPCNSVLPDLKVDVGGNYMATVRGSDINFAPVDNAGTVCFGGVQAIQSQLQIYGDILFKSQFVAFNNGNNSIGMAPHQ